MPKKSKQKSRTNKNKSSNKSSSGKATRESAAKNAEKASKASTEKVVEGTRESLQSGSQMYGRADELRARLNKLYSDAREQIEEMSKKIEAAEEEQTAKLRKEMADSTEAALQELQKKHKANIETVHKDIAAQQAKDVEAVKKSEEANADTTADQKRKEMEGMIESKEKEAEQDIDKFRKTRESDVEEQIARLKRNCEQEIAEYASKRKVVLKELIEQIKLRCKLEVANFEQREVLDSTVKTDQIIKNYQAVQVEQVNKLNQQLHEQTVKTKEEFEEKFNDKVRELKAATKEKIESVRKQVEDKFRKERVDCETELAYLMKNIKTNLKEERREIERRLEMKKELLAMLKMDDFVKITEEEFIESKYGCKILRNQSVFQNNRSCIYSARWSNKANKSAVPAVCKINLKSGWSSRHQNDFAKHSTKLLHYLTNLERTFKNLKNKKPAELALPFIRVYDVFVSDQKTYIFMEPLENTRPLDTFITANKSRSSKKSASNSTLTKEEIQNVMWQILNGIHFLNRMFIAHANVLLENISVSTEASLASAKVTITGLTRPIVYYNVESDTIVAVKGIEYSTDANVVEYYPPEAFSATFVPSGLDLFSWAVIACHMIRSKSPYPKSLLESPKKLMQAKLEDGISLEVPQHFGGQVVEQLISSITSPNTKIRPSIDEVLLHPFFQ